MAKSLRAESLEIEALAPPHPNRILANPIIDQMDESKAHRYFSADCFNATWDLIEKSDRTPDDDEMMRALAHASLFHWLKRDDITDQNRSISYWQLSRVYALLGNSSEALSYGQKCLDISGELNPFFIGYAHEALARAAKIAGDDEQASAQIQKARSCCEQTEDEGNRKALAKDLDDIEKL